MLSVPLHRTFANGPGTSISPSNLVSGANLAMDRGKTCQARGTKKAIGNPKALSAAEFNQICGGCHRKPPAAGEEPIGAILGTRVTSPCTSARAAAFAKARAGSRASPATRRTCGLTNRRTSAGAAGMRREPQHRTAVGRQNCVRCHMPKVGSRKPNLRFVNHWIGIYATGKPLARKSSGE